MFLTRAFLDGAQATSATPSSASTGPPHCAEDASGFASTWRSFMACPGQSPSPQGQTRAEDDLERLAAPMSPETRRQKMLQQRQRTLQQRQRQRRLLSPNPLMANDCILTNEVGSGSPVAFSRQTEGTSSSSSTLPSPSSPGGASPPLARLPPTRRPELGFRATASALLRGPSSTSADGAEDREEGGADLVLPAPPDAELREEEERRRVALAQELDERGIPPTYDPSLEMAQGRQAAFSLTNLALNGNRSEMRSFLMSPAPREAGMIECRIIRERGRFNKLSGRAVYTLESDAGVFLMTARKEKHNKTLNYTISMTKNLAAGKELEFCLGKLRSNLLGLEFTAYGTGLNPKKIDPTMNRSHAIQLARQELLSVQYSSSLCGSKPRGPRKMTAVIPRVTASGERLVCRTLSPDTEGLLAMQEGGSESHIEVYQNKPPKWNEQIGAFVLNFNKRVTKASVKNFQLTNAEDPDAVFLQFGRVGDEVFNMDFRYPFSAFQAFAICLSSFDYKLCCE